MSMQIPYEATKEPTIEYIPFDGLNFKTVFWLHPDSVQYRGRIVFVHGFSEESSLYTEFFDKLSNVGFDIFFFDQRGAGETSPVKDHGKTNEQLVFKDLDFMIKYNLENNPYKDDTKFNKLILMGHSMGGGIVLNYGIRGKYKEHIRSIITTAPEVMLHPSTAPNAVLKAFASFALKTMPNFRIDAGLKYEYITNNKKWIYYMKCHNDKFWITSGLYHGMITRGEALTKADYVAKFDPNISLLVFHSPTDHINHYEATKKFFGLLNDNVDKEFVSVKNAQHSLCIETDEVVQSMLDKIVDFVK